MLSTVVLPAPLGPITEKISPFWTSRLTFVTAWTPPNAFETPRISTSALICSEGGVAPSGHMSALVEIRGVSKAFGGVPAVTKGSPEVQKGEIDRKSVGEGKRVRLGGGRIC